MKVFWSWQSDRPVKVTKTFVQEALNEALQIVANDLDLSPAERPELDHDTKGEPGLVEIVNTIFSKIEKASVFVADVTPIAETGQGKKVPNPNVMIELGHAMKAIGHQSIILVANSAYGGRPEDLPFDLRHRRGAITYHLRDGDDDDRISAVRQKLIEDLSSALRLNLGAAISARDTLLEFAKHPSRIGDASIWLQENEQIRHGDFFGGAIERVLDIVGETRSYLRIAPASWSGQKPSRLDVHNAKGDERLWPLGALQNGDGGPNKLGVISVGLWKGQPGKCHTATQWFDKTGEIWGFDAGIAMSFNEAEPRYIGGHRLLKDWSTLLSKVIAFYKKHGANGPHRVEVGVVGLDGVNWPGSYSIDRSPSYEAQVMHERTSRDWSLEDQEVFLMEAYALLLKAFNRSPISTDEFKAILANTRA